MQNNTLADDEIYAILIANEPPAAGYNLLTTIAHEADKERTFKRAKDMRDRWTNAPGYESRVIKVAIIGRRDILGKADGFAKARFV